MTEHEWLSPTDPQPMLEFLRCRASERKLRLFAIASSRHVWPHLADKRSRRAVEIAEQFADGQASARDFRKAREGALAVFSRSHQQQWCGVSFRHGDTPRLSEEQHEAAWLALTVISLVERPHTTATRLIAGSRLNHVQLNVLYARLLREIVGNSFRPAHPDSLWPSWTSGCAVAIAQAISDDRAFDRLPILADALEEASCDDADLLAHFRAPGPHALGYWALDLVLQKP
jgi:hypothetical protein